MSSDVDDGWEVDDSLSIATTTALSNTARARGVGSVGIDSPDWPGSFAGSDAEEEVPIPPGSAVPAHAAQDSLSTPSATVALTAFNSFGADGGAAVGHVHGSPLNSSSLGSVTATGTQLALPAASNAGVLQHPAAVHDSSIATPAAPASPSPPLPVLLPSAEPRGAHNPPLSPTTSASAQHMAMAVSAEPNSHSLASIGLSGAGVPSPAAVLLEPSHPSATSSRTSKAVTSMAPVASVATAATSPAVTQVINAAPSSQLPPPVTHITVPSALPQALDPATVPKMPQVPPVALAAPSAAPQPLPSSAQPAAQLPPQPLQAPSASVNPQQDSFDDFDALDEAIFELEEAGEDDLGGWDDVGDDADAATEIPEAAACTSSGDSRPSAVMSQQQRELTVVATPAPPAFSNDPGAHDSINFAAQPSPETLTLGQAASATTAAHGPAASAASDREPPTAATTTALSTGPFAAPSQPSSERPGSEGTSALQPEAPSPHQARWDSMNTAYHPATADDVDGGGWFGTANGSSLPALAGAPAAPVPGAGDDSSWFNRAEALGFAPAVVDAVAADGALPVARAPSMPMVETVVGQATGSLAALFGGGADGAAGAERGGAPEAEPWVPASANTAGAAADHAHRGAAASAEQQAGVSFKDANIVMGLPMSSPFVQQENSWQQHNGMYGADDMAFFEHGQPPPLPAHPLPFAGSQMHPQHHAGFGADDGTAFFATAGDSSDQAMQPLAAEQQTWHYQQQHQQLQPHQLQPRQQEWGLGHTAGVVSGPFAVDGSQPAQAQQQQINDDDGSSFFMAADDYAKGSYGGYHQPLTHEQPWQQQQPETNGQTDAGRSPPDGVQAAQPQQPQEVQQQEVQQQHQQHAIPGTALGGSSTFVANGHAGNTVPPPAQGQPWQHVSLPADDASVFFEQATLPFGSQPGQAAQPWGQQQPGMDDGSSFFLQQDASPQASMFPPTEQQHEQQQQQQPQPQPHHSQWAWPAASTAADDDSSFFTSAAAGLPPAPGSLHQGQDYLQHQGQQQDYEQHLVQQQPSQDQVLRYQQLSTGLQHVQGPDDASSFFDQAAEGGQWQAQPVPPLAQHGAPVAWGPHHDMTAGAEQLPSLPWDQQQQQQQQDQQPQQQVQQHPALWVQPHTNEQPQSQPQPWQPQMQARGSQHSCQPPSALGGDGLDFFAASDTPSTAGGPFGSFTDASDSQHADAQAGSHAYAAGPAHAAKLPPSQQQQQQQQHMEQTAITASGGPALLPDTGVAPGQTAMSLGAQHEQAPASVHVESSQQHQAQPHTPLQHWQLAAAADQGARQVEAVTLYDVAATHQSQPPAPYPGVSNGPSPISFPGSAAAASPFQGISAAAQPQGSAAGAVDDGSSFFGAGSGELEATFQPMPFAPAPQQELTFSEDAQQWQQQHPTAPTTHASNVSLEAAATPQSMEATTAMGALTTSANAQQHMPGTQNQAAGAAPTTAEGMTTVSSSSNLKPSDAGVSERPITAVNATTPHGPWVPPVSGMGGPSDYMPAAVPTASSSGVVTPAHEPGHGRSASEVSDASKMSNISAVIFEHGEGQGSFPWQQGTGKAVSGGAAAASDGIGGLSTVDSASTWLGEAARGADAALWFDNTPEASGQDAGSTPGVGAGSDAVVAAMAGRPVAVGQEPSAAGGIDTLQQYHHQQELQPGQQLDLQQQQYGQQQQQQDPQQQLFGHEQLGYVAQQYHDQYAQYYGYHQGHDPQYAYGQYSQGADQQFGYYQYAADQQNGAGQHVQGYGQYAWGQAYQPATDQHGQQQSTMMQGAGNDSGAAPAMFASHNAADAAMPGGATTYESQWQQQQQQQQAEMYGIQQQPYVPAASAAVPTPQPWLYSPSHGAAPSAYGNLYEQQSQQQQRTHGMLVELPVSEQAARMCPHGRPAMSLVAFGFGGQVVLVRPATTEQFSGGTSATVTITQLVNLPASLQPAVPAAAAAASGRTNRRSTEGKTPARVSDEQGQGEVSMDLLVRLLTSFPGPLGPATSKDKVLKYIQERVQGSVQEEPYCSQQAVVKVMWQMLGAMVKNPPGGGGGGGGGAAGGALRLMGWGQAKDADLGAELSKLLSSLATPSTSPPVHGMALPGHAVLGAVPSEQQLADAAAAMQLLLVQGKKQEALKVALDRGLWGPALLLASSLGDKAWSDAAAALATSALAAGSPLRSMALLMAGRAEQLVMPAGAPGAIAGAGGGMTGGVGAQPDALLHQWAANLSVLAGHRQLPGALEAIMGLGSRLQGEAGQVLEAHLCYTIAGCGPGFTEPPDPTDAGAKAASGAPAAATATAAPRYCLLGVDHQECPRTFAASVLALQRTELLEWTQRGVGPGAGPGSGAGFAAPGGGGNATAMGPTGPGADGGLPAFPALLPYKLLYAHTLAEMGRIQDAIAYTQALEGSLRALATQSRPPPSFALLSRELEVLRDRLSSYASARSIPSARTGSSLAKIGGFLDRTLNKLLWGGADPTAGGPGGPGGPGAPGPGGAAGPPGTGLGTKDGRTATHPVTGPTVAYGGPNVPIPGQPLVAAASAASTAPGTPASTSGGNSAMAFAPGYQASGAAASTLASAPSSGLASGHRSVPGGTSIFEQAAAAAASVDAAAHRRSLSTGSGLSAQAQANALAGDIAASTSPAEPRTSGGGGNSGGPSLQHQSSGKRGAGLPPLHPQSPSRRTKDVADAPDSTSASASSSRRTTGFSSLFGMFGTSGSGTAAGEGGGPKSQGKRDPLEDTDSIYYDKAKGRWVTRGEEDKAYDSPLPPPPTSFAFAAPAAAPGSGTVAGPEPGMPTPMSGSGPASTGSSAIADALLAATGAPPPTLGMPAAARTRGGPRARYVDTFSAPGPAPAVPFAPASGLLPAMPGAPTAPAAGSTFGSTAAGPKPPGAPSFFVPAAEHQNTGGTSNGTAGGAGDAQPPENAAGQAVEQVQQYVGPAQQHTLQQPLQPQQHADQQQQQGQQGSHQLYPWEQQQQTGAGGGAGVDGSAAIAPTSHPTHQDQPWQQASWHSSPYASMYAAAAASGDSAQPNSSWPYGAQSSGSTPANAAGSVHPAQSYGYGQPVTAADASGSSNPAQGYGHEQPAAHPASAHAAGAIAEQAQAPAHAAQPAPSASAASAMPSGATQATPAHWAAWPMAQSYGSAADAAFSQLGGDVGAAADGASGVHGGMHGAASWAYGAGGGGYGSGADSQSSGIAPHLMAAAWSYDAASAHAYQSAGAVPPLSNLAVPSGGSWGNQQLGAAMAVAGGAAGAGWAGRSATNSLSTGPGDQQFAMQGQGGGVGDGGEEMKEIEL